MPRRSPPSSLRLVQGPVPPRSVPKFGHTLPSVPRPTFSQPAMVVRGPAPRQQASRQESVKFDALPALVIPIPSSRGSLRGPWDHTRIQTPIVVEEMLTPLEPVASTL